MILLKVDFNSLHSLFVFCYADHFLNTNIFQIPNSNLDMIECKNVTRLELKS